MKRPPRLSPIERALVEKRWHETALDAQIHSLIGNNSHRMVNESGKVLFVVLGAAMTEGIPAEDPDIRIIRGAVNAVHDQAGEEEIDDLRRATIQSGLQAALRIVARVPRRATIDAAVDLELKLKTKDAIRLSDFVAVMPNQPRPSQ